MAVAGEQGKAPYRVERAYPTEKLDTLLVFRSVHPLYGAFLLQHLGLADRDERIQALESVLEMPRPLLRYVRVPWPEELPPGPAHLSVGTLAYARPAALPSCDQKPRSKSSGSGNRMVACFSVAISVSV